MAAKDSLYNIDYLQEYGQRIGLDRIVLQKMSSIDSNYYNVTYTLIDLKTREQIHSVNRQFNTQNPELFFESILSDMNMIFKIKIDSSKKFQVPSLSAIEFYARGREAELLKNDLNSAVDYYRQGLNQDSTYLPLIVSCISSLLRLSLEEKKGDAFVDAYYIEADRWLDNMLIIHPNLQKLHHLRGRLYIQKELWSKAEQSLLKAYQLNPRDPELLFDWSRLHPSRYKSIGYSSKEALLKQALHLNPAFEKAYLALGEVYYFQNRHQAAETIFLKWLHIQPESLEALLALGKIYVLRNDVIQIIDTYQKVLTIDPQNVIAFFNLGIAYYSDEKLEEARGFFQRAIALGNHSDSHFYLGVIYARQGDKEKALSHLRERIRQRSNSDDIYAEEARKLLFDLLHEEETVDVSDK